MALVIFPPVNFIQLETFYLYFLLDLAFQATIKTLSKLCWIHGSSAYDMLRKSKEKVHQKGNQ